MDAKDLLSKAENDSACSLELSNAQSLFEKGCSDLMVSTGLDYKPEFLAHALRHPEMAASLCAAIDQSCRALTDPARQQRAKLAVDNLALAVQSMRRAVSHVAGIHSARAKAISAYSDNT